MASVADPLLRDGLEALARLLPRGYSVAPSTRTPLKGETWIVIRLKDRRPALCLVLARRRVEPRDLGAIAAQAAKTQYPALLLSPYLSPAVQERLRGFGLGYWDLAGNAQLSVDAVELCIERNTGLHPGKGCERGTRSLCGEMAGRVVRALVDLRPPYAVAEVAEQARVDVSCASRVVAFLGEARMLEHKPRKKIEKVDWAEILRRWSLDSPLVSRGEASTFVAGRGCPDLLARLAPIGLLHAITGKAALAQMTLLAGAGGERVEPEAFCAGVLVMYVDEPAAAVGQLFLHPAGDDANVMLIKPSDRSVFHRSSEEKGLRYVSPSLAAADLEDEQTFEQALAWMERHESAWRR
jgi:hypothetical protein